MYDYITVDNVNLKSTSTGFLTLIIVIISIFSSMMIIPSFQYSNSTLGSNPIHDIFTNTNGEDLDNEDSEINQTGEPDKKSNELEYQQKLELDPKECVLRKQNSSKETHIDTNSYFLTYQSPLFRFTIQYPYFWQKVEERNKVIFYLPFDNNTDKTRSYFSVNILPANNILQNELCKTTVEYLRESLPDFRLLELSEIALNGNSSAYMIVYTYKDFRFGMLKEMDILMPSRDKIYLISYIADTVTFPIYVPTIIRMISSFNFDENIYQSPYEYMEPEPNNFEPPQTTGREEDEGDEVDDGGDGDTFDSSGDSGASGGGGDDGGDGDTGKIGKGTIGAGTPGDRSNVLPGLKIPPGDGGGTTTGDGTTSVKEPVIKPPLLVLFGFG
jgi:uncharacterized membrane protein YgcG